MSYKKLDIWKEARSLSIDIHELSRKLPAFEQFEEGQQIRRSIKSVRSNIVEGYGRRTYKKEFIRFMIFALASNDETIDHLETLYETKSMTDDELFKNLYTRLDILGRKINNFISALERNHNKKFSVSEPSVEYMNQSTIIEDSTCSIPDVSPETSIKNQGSSIDNREAAER